MPERPNDRRWWNSSASGPRECQKRLDHNQNLPSFLIVGPPRTGTSWLHEILRKRTLLPSLSKETRFFDSHFHRGLNWYRAHYAASGGTRSMGEIAPTYFASDQARQRIKQVLPHAKIVCVFRNPVERIFSLYRVKRAYGLIPWGFQEALLLDQELAESSRYATHLKTWMAEFGAERVLPTLYDDLRDSPQKYLDRLADFIGIPRFRLSTPELRSVHSSETMTHPRCYFRTRSATRVAEWLKARHFGPFVSAVKNSPVSKLFLGGGPSFAGLSDESSLMVQELFLSEVEDLEAMLQRDLSAWKPFRGDVACRELTDLDDQFRAAA